MKNYLTRHKWGVFFIAFALVYVATVIFAATSNAATAPPAVSKAATRIVAKGDPSFKVLPAKCSTTVTQHIYQCSFVGINKTTHHRVCVASYVHYNPGHPSQTAIWQPNWRCGAIPTPISASLLPPYPGDPATSHTPKLKGPNV